MWDEPNVWLKRYTLTLMRYHERCWLIQTAGRWPWKSESAKECVTTHLPNELALKMDGAEACRLYPAVGALVRPQRVGRRGGPWRSLGGDPGWNGPWCRSWW